MTNKWMKFAAAGALAAGLALAQTAPVHPQNQNGTRAQKWAMARRQRMQQLNLSEAQKEQAKTIFQQARQSAQPMVQRLRQDREAMRAAVKANDTTKIQQLSVTEGKLRGEIMAVHAGAMAKFYQTLTPEQRAKADRLGAERRHATGA